MLRKLSVVMLGHLRKGFTLGSLVNLGEGDIIMYIRDIAMTISRMLKRLLMLDLKSLMAR